MSKEATLSSLDRRCKYFGTEISLRLALVDKLRAECGQFGAVLANEVRYGAGDRRADFLSLTDVAHAFEIKSDFDTLTRLGAQMADYTKTFDYVTVVTTERHLKKAKQILPRKTGLWLCREDTLIGIRAARQNQRLSKLHLASGCTRSGLIRVLKSAKTTDSVGTLQEMAVRSLKVSELRHLFHDELMCRYSTVSARFFHETDSKLAPEDLFLLRRACKIAP